MITKPLKHKKSTNTKRSPHSRKQLVARKKTIVVKYRKYYYDKYNRLVKCKTTKKEHKQVKYQKEKRIILIDGSSVAYEHGNHKVFSVQGIAIALDYFQRHGFTAKAIISHWAILAEKDSELRTKLINMRQNGSFIVYRSIKEPTERELHRFLLATASEQDGVIVTNFDLGYLLNEKETWNFIINSRKIGFSFYEKNFYVLDGPYGKSGPTLYEILFKD